MKKSLTGKTVLITGASSGLGKEISIECARRGAALILIGRNPKALYDTYEECATANKVDRHYYLTADFSKLDSVEQLWQTIDAMNIPIDVLINNAGYGIFDTIENFSIDEIEKMFNVNVLSLIYLSQQCAIKMIERHSGHIINIASMAGKIATPKTTIYSATKFSVIGFSNALRLELAPLNIPVTTVNLGPMNTNFFNIADPSGQYINALNHKMLNPKKVAKKITDNILYPKREINLPKIMELASIIYPVFPKLSDLATRTLFNKK